MKWTDFKARLRTARSFSTLRPRCPRALECEVLPIQGAQPTLGMREEDWPTTEAGIAALLVRMDQVESGWLSQDDDDAWRAALQAQKEFEKTQFFADAEKLRSMWE